MKISQILTTINAVIMIVCAFFLSLSCDDITVCELPESLNTCEGHDECFLVYCGVECCPCKRVASENQFDETYCMVKIEDGFDAARRQCQEAREKSCDGVECGGIAACPQPVKAECREGRCVPVH